MMAQYRTDGMPASSGAPTRSSASIFFVFRAYYVASTIPALDVGR